MKRLVLVDGNALFHRAFHATPPLTTSKGELINAVFGLTNMLLKTWDDLKPDYLTVAWDRAAPTFRHQEYTQYKATRKPLDEALGSQYGRVHEVISAFGIPEFALDGYEADDLIGTLARQAGEKGGIEVIILTGDRDIMQIINGYVKVLMPKKTLSDVGLYGEAEFVEKYGFKPKQIIDFKALAGDQSDNIPGVPGIGEVSATKLILQFGSMEKIYLPKNLKTLPERMQKLLGEGAESAVLSKKLATLDLNAPVKLDLKACEVKDYKREEVAKIFEELEFKSLLGKITGKGKDPLKGENQLGLNVSPVVSGSQNKTTTNLDLEVSKILEKMSKTGILIDLKYLENSGNELKKRLEFLKSEIFKTVGHEFNLNSPKQLSEVLFDELKLPVYKKTKTGRSTDEATLNELSEAHPMIPLFLEYRQLFKLVSTYIDALPKSIAQDGRIHSTFNVEGAATGRLSSNNPNLQNIPVKGNTGGEIRKAFIASPGKIFLGADYSQIELRILAHVSGDENLTQAFKDGLDIHAATASKIFNVPVSEVTKQQRMVGKTMNFATLYGQGPRALSKQLKIDYATAKNYIDDYFMQFPRVKVWMNKILEEGRKLGYVKTISGRRRFIPELQSQNRFLQAFGERAAINHPIQGCLPWETKILTSGGYIPIGELYVAKNRPAFVWDGSAWKVYDVLDRGKAQLAELKFSNGQVLKCDTRHKVLTIGDYGYEWKEFLELQTGMKVCFSAPNVHEFSSKPFKYKHFPKVHNGISLDITADKEFWYWIGYYIGDGYIHKKWNRAWVYSLAYYFGEHEIEKRQKCISFFTKLGLRPVERKMTHRPANLVSTRYEVKIHSQGLGKVFEELDLLTGKTAHTKNLPRSIFTETLENRCAFIKGIMDSDGTDGIKEKNSPNIHICQRELLQEIQLLLRTVGTESKIRGPFIYRDRISYRLDIHRNSLAQVIDQGEFAYYSRSIKSMAPTFLTQEAVSRGRYLQKSQFATGSDYVLYSRWKNGGSSSLHHLNTWLKKNKVFLKTPLYYYNEIIDIKVLDEVETTYTLNVPGSHRFDSEGVISKNTSADMIKKAMVEIHSVIASEAKQSCQLILQVHDELLFECDSLTSPSAVSSGSSGSPQVQKLAKLVCQKMENALVLSVPVKVDLKVGPNWGEMVPLKI